VSPVFWKWY